MQQMWRNSNFQRRADDNEDSLRTRLMAYYKQTSPLVGYYYAKGDLVSRRTVWAAWMTSRPASPLRWGHAIIYSRQYLIGQGGFARKAFTPPQSP